MDSKRREDFTLIYLLITSSCLMYFLLAMPSSSLAGFGPHHPKSSVREIHSSHHHPVPQKSDDGTVQKITEDRQLLQDKEHIKEDMGEWVLEGEKELTPEEMEFHYFRMHDFDNNSQLDGLEILQALTHVLPLSDEQEQNSAPADSHSHNHNSGPAKNNRAVISDENFNYYIDLIDKVLEEDDVDKDGYLSYAEYVIGRRKDDGHTKPNH